MDVRNPSSAQRMVASRASGRLPSVGAMISPAATALASSAACIATTSSWLTAVRRGYMTSEHERPNPKALQARTVGATAAPHHDVHQALIASGIFRKSEPDVVSAWIRHYGPSGSRPGTSFFPKVTPATVCT